MRGRGFLGFVFLALALAAAAGQAPPAGTKRPAGGSSPFVLEARGGAAVPLLDSAELFSTGFSAALALSYSSLPLIKPFARLGFAQYPILSTSSSSSVLYPLSIIDCQLGASAGLTLGERFSLGISAGAGPAFGLMTGKSTALMLNWSLGGSLGFRVSPSVEIDLLGDWNAGGSFPGLQAGMGARLRLGEMGSTPRFSAEFKNIDPVFPVFYSYYDRHPLGTVRLSNGEKTTAREVRVSFLSGQYMAQPKLCASFDSLPPGASVDLPLYALFGEDILSVSSNGLLPSTVIVEYRLLGSERRAELPLKLTLLHRNAMSWTDDRRAAAFASPKDPAVLWFSKSVASVVNDRLRPGASRNLQLAMGLFEAEELFGINYVVDPASAYAANVQDESVIDFLQYPAQTLSYRGGDCDDLSILYCSLLESLGIESAFITIPGHIYAAFRLDIDEKAARAAFSDPGLYIVRDGGVWLPVEVTMVKDGFVKAWRIGAKEWYDSEKEGSAKFWPLREAWETYASASVPDAKSRYALPSDAEMMQAFDLALDRYIAKLIAPEVRAIAMDPTKPQSPEVENSLGVLYGRNGMLKESWSHLSAAAKAGEGEAWTNLANVAYLRRDYALAGSYYAWALKLDPTDDLALLGSARASYELERFDQAGSAYALLKSRNPELAAAYPYLAAMYGGEGRPWSLSERLATTRWGDPVERRRLAALQASRLAAAPPPAPAPVPQKTLAPAYAAAPAPTLAPVPSDASAPAAAPPPTVAPVPAAAPVAEAVESAVPAPPSASAAQAALPTESAPAAVASAEPTAEAVPQTIQSAAPSAADAPLESETASAPAAVEVAPVEPTRPEPAAPVSPEPSAGIAASVAPAEPEAPAVPAPSAPLLSAAVPPEAPVLPAPSAAVPPEVLSSAAVEKAVAQPTVAPVLQEAAPVDLDLAAAQRAAERAREEEAERARQEAAAALSSSAVAKVVVQPTAAPVLQEAAPVDLDLVAAQEAAERAAAEDEAAKTASMPVSAPAPEVQAVAESAAPEPEARVASASAPEPQPERVPEPSPEPAPAPQPQPTSEPRPAATVLASVEPPEEPVDALSSASIEADKFLPYPPPAAPVPTEIASVPPERAATAPEEVPDSTGEVKEEAAAPEAEPAKEEAVAALPPASPEAIVLAEGFDAFRPALGRWSVDERRVAHSEETEYFAKMLMALPPHEGKLRYSFEARSTGRAWVGYGLHFSASPLLTHRGYGEGRSYLLWITSDPVHLKGAGTRIQLYRSERDTQLTLVADQAMPESIFDRNSIEVIVDPAEGSVKVLVNGEERLAVGGLVGLAEGDYLVLRALDKTEFYSFKTEIIK